MEREGRAESHFTKSCRLQVKTICEEMGVGFLGVGFDPKWPLSKIPTMPKGR